MELKLSVETLWRGGENSSNRTFMELKLFFRIKTYSFITVLIVPLWN